MICNVEVIEKFPLPDTSMGRSKGIHVSNIIRSLAIESGILTTEDCDDLSLVDVRSLNHLPIGRLLSIHNGLAWERYYIPLLPGVIDHPREMCVDDIYMTHDGEEVASYLIDRVKERFYTRVHEVKFTYKSTRGVGDLSHTSRKSPFMWLAQIMAYLHGCGSTKAVLHVYFACGDYYRPIQPQLRKYYLEFKPREIAENWSMLLNYRDYRLKLDANPELLKPVSFGDWAGVDPDETT